MEGAPFVIPTPMAARPRRPSVLTTASVVLLIQAALTGLGGALVLSLRTSSLSPQLLQTRTTQLSQTVGVLLVVLAALELIAGLLVLRLSGAGRLLGLVLAGVGLVTGVVALVDGQGTAILGMAMNLFLIYAFTTTGDVFARARRG